ncbi:MAG: response regulator [Candidatus Margulisbacteria bacterium]|nr:response regulator [Candidatus Margulisiibacteriota bacterium]
MTNNTILIIDDDKELVEEITEILTFEGYQVLSAHTGDTGLVLFKSCQPRLVLLDMKLPGISGIKLISIFKSLQPNTPIIMISGRPVYSPLCKQDKIEHNLEEQRLKMVDLFMNKPFAVEHLISSIDRLFNKTP